MIICIIHLEIEDFVLRAAKAILVPCQEKNGIEHSQNLHLGIEQIHQRILQLVALSPLLPMLVSNLCPR